MVTPHAVSDDYPSAVHERPGRLSLGLFEAKAATIMLSFDWERDSTRRTMKPGNIDQDELKDSHCSGGQF
jgi:hypothetical protein